ncbi:hypothetical protein QR680_006148 [Steinernema hermaphroditum]|uniref:Uncharacterized protein n=1 Tax=Steinernema hermaphroditum TaxID=289476 RepID=A0AA39LWL9_9BILA|nr:hypothetical protein QR680_006148 [Steinernema hermaphroditum]
MFLIPYGIIKVFDQIDIYIQYPAVLLNLLVIFISFWRVKPSLPRTYCLNISIMSLICALFTIANDITKRTLFKHYNEDHDTIYTVTVVVLEIMLMQSTLNLYLFQATLTIFLAYVGFTKPVLYKRMAKTRAFPYAFIIAHALSWILASGSTLEYFSTQPLFEDYNRVALFIHTWTRVGLQLGVISLMVFLYIITLLKLTIYRSSHFFHNVGAQSRWLVLRSVLVYCTPPNVFVVPGIAGSYCAAVTATLTPREERNFATTCLSVKYLADQLIMLRLFVTSLSALLAFSDYRRALFCIFMKILPGKNSLHSAAPQSADF